MNRRAFVLTMLGNLAAAGASLAASFEDSVVAQLQAQGYRQIRIEHTLLGRVRIVATLRGLQREIILNPRTGEVLRDVVVDAEGAVVPQIARASGNGGSNSGGSGSSDDGEDDGGNDDGGSGGGSGDDDGGDDDNSGSGSGGSGSGGSGSGSDDGHEDDGSDDHSEDSGSEDHEDSGGSDEQEDSQDD